MDARLVEGADEILEGPRLEPHRELLGAAPVALDRGELSKGGGRRIRNEPLAGRMWWRLWSRGDRLDPALRRRRRVFNRGFRRRLDRCEATHSPAFANRFGQCQDLG